jgi:hypothetical protein
MYQQQQLQQRLDETSYKLTALHSVGPVSNSNEVDRAGTSQEKSQKGPDGGRDNPKLLTSAFHSPGHLSNSRSTCSSHA